jgi:hypothetical protein
MDIVVYRVLVSALICACDFLLTFAISGTGDPAGDTRTYPDISWWSAEQKSVQ